MSATVWVQRPDNGMCSFERCRERRFWEDSGLLVCRRGHVQDGIVETLSEYVSSQAKTFVVKVEKKQRESTVLSGLDALKLFVQSYQLLLRHQCHALIHKKGFPARLENIVKDLWALRLQLIEKRLRTSRDGESGAETGGETEAEESEGDGYESEINSKRLSKHERKKPTVLDSVSLCYFAMILLKIPISLGDIYRWVLAEDIPYLRPQRLLPLQWLRALPNGYSTALEPRKALEPGDLHHSVHALAALYKRRFGLGLVPINSPPLLFFYIRELSLPIQVFTAVHLISSLIPKAFHFPKPKYRQQVHSLPELQLVALIIVAIKLYHPLDDVTRFVTSETDLGFLAIDWKVWQEAQEKRKKTIPPSKSAFPPGGESRLKESDVFDLTGAQIDSYLDWYEKTFEHPQSSEFASDDLSRKILALFPTSRVRSSVTKSESADDAARTSEIARDNAIRAVTGALKVRGVVSDEQAEQIKRPISRVGDGYRIYWKQEELEGTTRVFFEMIAELAGIDLDMLVAAVRKIEIKLEGLKDSNRSAGEAGEEKADAEAPKPEGEVMDIDAPGANEKPA